MERKIGDTFEFEGKKIEVKAASNGECYGCILDGKCYSPSNEVVGHCEADFRKDNKEVIFVEVQEQQDEQSQEQTEQPQELNLCEILKYCPQGETFWSPMLNGVKFLYIDEERQMIIVETIEGHFTWEINADATISIDEVTSPEIMLYPSREQRDWTKVNYEKKLPKTWKKFCENYPRKKDEAYFDMGSQICIFSQDYEYRTEDTDKNIMPSKQAAEAHLALIQLHQLRDCWREGWVPDWTDDNQIKYVIYNPEGEFRIGRFSRTRRFLAFQDEKRAEEFKDCFIDLIRKAGDFI